MKVCRGERVWKEGSVDCGDEERGEVKKLAGEKISAICVDRFALRGHTGDRVGLGFMNPSPRRDVDGTMRR